MSEPARTLGDSSLIDLLDRLVETGVVATGDVLLGLADVDLIRVNLQLVLGAVDTLMADGDPSPTALPRSEAMPAPQQPTPIAPAVGPRTNDAPHTDAPHAGAAHIDAPHADAPHTNTSHTDAPAPPRSTLVPAAPLPPEPADRSDLGIGALLVAVIEIVHRLLERQAIHRMERGALTDDQIERLGQALMALDQRVEQLIQIFSTRSAPALPVTVTGLAR
jgi:hypothetical protein